MEAKKHKTPKTLLEAIRYFADEDVAHSYAATLRWPNGPVCPRCSCKEYSYLTTRRLWKCKGCRYQYSVKKNTIFEDSPLGFSKWLPAVWLVVLLTGDRVVDAHPPKHLGIDALFTFVTDDERVPIPLDLHCSFYAIKKTLKSHVFLAGGKASVKEPSVRELSNNSQSLRIKPHPYIDGDPFR